MCIHSASVAEIYEANLRATRGSKHKTVLSMRRKDGTFAEAWVVDVRDEQRIANTIRDMRRWHRGTRVADMERVNARRAALGLSALTEDGLPVPVGEAHPGFEGKHEK
jgi:hypothetical protein